MDTLKDIKDPEEIERTSFKIIEEEAGPHSFSIPQWRVVRRIIHTTADFEMLSLVCFHELAIPAGISAIKRGCTIFTDTNMVKTGINKKTLHQFGCEIKCFMGDKKVMELAKKSGTTRASIAVDMVAPQLDGNIYVVGNAPTALIRLLEVINEKMVKPALVVAVPVGFVNAKESKEIFVKYSPVPYITIQGRKGGSAVGAAIINELAKMASE